ncbi:MAG: ABC transporter permease [Ardenticatenaceae bacterium]
MAAVTAATPEQVISVPAEQSPMAEIWANLRRSWSAMLGLGLILFHLVMALVSPYVTPYDPLKFDAQARSATPSAEHVFGTDKLGRDILSRSMMGGRVTLIITVIGTTIAVVWGGLFGILIGFLGGRIDEAIMRVVDALLSIPWLLFLLLIVSIVGTEIWVLIVTLGFFYGIAVIRISRAATLDFVAREFIMAARARGEKKRTVVLRELLPNVLDVLLVEGAMRWSWMLLAFSSLSFLGFGVAPPTPDWGLMIAKNREILAIQPWATFGPMIMLSSLIIGINLFADALAKAVGLDRSQGAPV